MTGTNEKVAFVSDNPGRGTGVVLHGCPGQGSCGGMFTYNTMQTFLDVLGMEPLRMVSPASDDPRRHTQFPDELLDRLVRMTDRGIKPRDIVTPASLRNATSVVLAMAGSTNVALHGVEIRPSSTRQPDHITIRSLAGLADYLETTPAEASSQWRQIAARPS